MIMTFGAFVGASYQVATIFIQYYRYDVTVSKTFTFKRQTVFPAVTFCNMNPVKRTAVSGNSQLSALTSQHDKRKRRQTQKNRDDDIKRTKIQIKLRHKRSSMLIIINISTILNIRFFVNFTTRPIISIRIFELILPLLK